MIRVDTSIWIDHFNKDGDETLQVLFASESIVTHAFVVGEIAMGSIKNRAAQLALLDDLPQLPMARDDEVRLLIEARNLFATRLSYIDAHLLTASLASPPERGVRLWTRDKPLSQQAERLGVAYIP